MNQNSNGLLEASSQTTSVPPVSPGAPAANQADEEGAFNLRDFFILCLNKWRWFAVSILIFLCLGVFYILSTPKTYTRTASVMINEDTESGQGVASALSDMGLFQSSADVNNEMLAFQSPAIISDVIKRLGLGQITPIATD